MDNKFADLKKKATKKLLKYISTKEGMKKLDAVLEAKRNLDERLTGIYRLIGLPSLRDKETVQQAIGIHENRIKNLGRELDELESVLDRIEKVEATIIDQPQAAAEMVELKVKSEPKTVLEIATQKKPEPKAKPEKPVEVKTKPAAKKKPLPPKAPSSGVALVKKVAQPVKAAKTAVAKPIEIIKSAKPVSPAAIKPQPLGAAKSGKRSAPSKSLLDLNFKNPPKPKTKKK